MTLPHEPDEETHQRFMAEIEPMRAVVLDLVHQTHARREATSLIPAADSPAIGEMAQTAELSARVGGQPILDALSLANLELVAAEDAIQAQCHLVAMRQPFLYVDKILVRCSLEASGRALWLLDPTLDARRRACRGLTQRLVDLTAMIKLLGGDQRQSRIERREELVRRARAAGLIVHRRKGHPPEVEDHWPSERKVMRDLLAYGEEDEIDVGDIAQRFLSLFVHATTAGLLQARSTTWPAGVRPPPTLDGMVASPLTMNSSDVRFMLVLAAAGYMIAANANARLHGWDDEPWRRMMSNARETVRRATKDA